LLQEQLVLEAQQKLVLMEFKINEKLELTVVDLVIVVDQLEHVLDDELLE